MKNKGLIIKILISILILVFLVSVGKSIYDKTNKTNEILNVRKVTFSSYDNVECLDYSCNSIMLEKEDKITLLNDKGEKIAKYKKSDSEKPVEVSDKYYITKSTKTDKYYVYNTSNKKLYETDGTLKVLNDKYLVFSKDSYKSIITAKGEVKYKKLKSVETYDDYFQISDDENYYVLDEDLKKVLKGYKIAKTIYDDDENVKYMIVKNEKKDNYNYFSVKKDKIIGKAFTTYTTNDDEITVKDKNNIKYLLKDNGNQDRITFSDELKKKYEKKYTIYEDSIYEENQKYILVDNKKDKSFGILNTKKGKYELLYKYKKDRSSIYSSVSKLKSDDLTLKIVCYSYICDKEQTIIYNMKDNKTVFKINGIISSYNEYENNYKIISISGKDKYRVYDKNNKKVFESDKNLALTDTKIKVGSLPYSNIYLYSIKDKKIINKEGLYHTYVDDNVIYRYDKDSKKIFLNEKGKEIIKVETKADVWLSNNTCIYYDSKSINMYNIEKDKTYKYKFLKNEEMKNTSGSVVYPYNNAIFINNSKDKYVKVIDFNGKTLKKINDTQIYLVKYNSKNYKAYLILKNNDKKYELYIAE